jgi:hypothetical protein
MNLMLKIVKLNKNYWLYKILLKLSIVEINKLNNHLKKSRIQVTKKNKLQFPSIRSFNLGDEMTRLEELEEQSRHLMDKVRTKRRKVEDIKNDLKVNQNSSFIFHKFIFIFLAYGTCI